MLVPWTPGNGVMTFLRWDYQYFWVFVAVSQGDTKPKEKHSASFEASLLKDWEGEQGGNYVSILNTGKYPIFH